MSETDIILIESNTSNRVENNSTLESPIIKEEFEDILLFSQSEMEVSDEPKLLTAATNANFILPGFNEKPAQLLNKYPIQLGEFDNGRHFIKHVLQDDKPSKVWECGICSKEFGHQYTLMRHLPTHTDERKYQCNICGKAFRQMSTLSQHRAIHSAERPYVCEICHKTFNRVSTLISHRKTHTGLKPHQCHLCNKAFHQKGNLRNHIFTHTNERPYKCEICSKGFNQMSNLMCHKIKAHHRSDKPRYTCQICGKDFQKRMGLRNHEQYQHGVQNPDPTTSSSNTKYTNGVLVEPINTAAMQHALATSQTPFALLRPLNGIPVLVRVLSMGDKQMLVPATAEDLKKHGQITITPQVDDLVKKENIDPLTAAQTEEPIQNNDADESTSKSLGSTVQIKIPVVATVVQRCGKDGNMCMAIESPGPYTEGINQENYFLTTATSDNINGDYNNLNFTGVIENHVLTPADIQYVDECGNVLNLDDYKTDNPTCAPLHYETQVNSISNVITFPENEDNEMNNYVDTSTNSVFEILEKDEVISLSDSNDISELTNVSYDPAMCSDFVLP